MHFKKNQLLVLESFRNDVFLSKSIRALALQLKKDYPSIHKVTHELVRQHILLFKKVGKANVCELTFSPESLSVLSFLEEQQAFTRALAPINEVLSKKEFSEDIILVTGSYAKKTQTPRSDIDIVVVTKDDAFKKLKLTENLTALSLPKVHPIVITYDDFSTMLLINKATFGKEVFKNHLIYQNASKYYRLIKEAIEHGFRGQVNALRATPLKLLKFA